MTDSLVSRAVAEWLAAGHVAPGTPLMVACSGGADSLALALGLRAVAGTYPIAASVVDHGLQGDSAQVAASAVHTLRDIGFHRVDTTRVQVDGPGGIEAAARRARYAALTHLAQAWSPDAAILLAHTADDQAETVLLGLARGSGPRSIAGMRPWRAPWGRPLLAVRRSDTERACTDAGIAFWRDPHNANPAFARVRLRSEVLPLMDAVLGGGVTPALARTAELMADDLDALDAIAETVLTDAVGPATDLAVTALNPWPSAVRRRVLRRWVADRAGVTELTFAHLVRLEGLVTGGRSGQSVRLPGGIDVVRRRSSLVISPQPPG